MMWGELLHAQVGTQAAIKKNGLRFALIMAESKQIGGVKMNQDIFQGKWEQAKAKVKQQWAKLTDDDIQRIEGKGDELRGRLQERYGLSKEEAEKQVKKFSETLH